MHESCSFKSLALSNLKVLKPSSGDKPKAVDLGRIFKRLTKSTTMS